MRLNEKLRRNSLRKLFDKMEKLTDIPRDSYKERAYHLPESSITSSNLVYNINLLGGVTETFRKNT
jgi:hypothetical protein